MKPLGIGRMRQAATDGLARQSYLRVSAFGTTARKGPCHYHAPGFQETPITVYARIRSPIARPDRSPSGSWYGLSFLFAALVRLRTYYDHGDVTSQTAS